ncbi:MAG: DUF1553 domain-containing protein [Bacteroidota bacterium]
MRVFWYSRISLFKPAYILGLAILFTGGCSRTAVDPALEEALPALVDYNFHIKPILSDRCFTCHGPDENTREAELRLDTPEGLFATLSSSSGKAIVPGNAHKSELIKRIRHDDPEEVMPPPASNLTVSDYEVALLQRWIEQGANWKQHWSFIPPTTPTPPAVDQTAWVTNEIDQFVVDRLEREGLAPAQTAAPEQLVRRLTFDLTGLPPTLEELDAFLADTSLQAYETLVDQLLAKKAFGERMASEWLDIARYADTGGYQSDRLRRMWPWRDWVIDAFNTNLGYDKFVTWQLAGDLLPNPTQEQVLATAFNRNHRQTEEGGSIEEEFRMEYVADRTNTMSTAFMGLTMECARCHDHKYDPISQKEYYQLFAFFNNIDESGQTSFFTDAVPVPTMLLSDRDTIDALEQTRQAIARKAAELDTHMQASTAAFESWFTGLKASPLSQAPPKGLTTHIPFETIADEQTPNLANRRQPGHTIFNPEITSGKVGQAVQFDGENGLEFKGAGVFERTDAFTVAFWMKATKWNPWNALVHRTKATYDAGSRGYELSLEHNKLVAGLSHMWPENAIRVITTDSLPANTWVHVAMTYNGSSKADGVSLYVNGKPAATETIRDNLTRTIKYERVEVNLTTGYRFRDTGFQDGLLDDLRVYNRALTPFELTYLTGDDPFQAILGKSPATLAAADRDALTAFYREHADPAYRTLQTDLKRLRVRENEQVTPIHEMMVMREMQERRPTHILRRGAYDDKGEEVSPGTPAAMLAFDEALPQNRLGLATWLTDAQHPLTARVAVNRFWQMFFEQGLVVTPDDFGSQGALPSHPALLDWLATTFVDSDWDVKAMLKTIVMSSTYRQASAVSPELRSIDPANQLLARGPKKRLAAEMIRDNALATSALLVDKVGGPPVKPYQPAGLWKEKSGTAYERDTGEGLYRRSLYTFWRRTSPPPSMITFDATRRNMCVVRRQQTSTPMQALVLLNDPQYVEASRILAQRLLQSSDASLQSTITQAFRLLTSRPPTAVELDIMRQTYEEQLAEFSANQADATQLLQIGDTAWDRTLAPEKLAATTILVNTVMNFEAAIINR